MRKSLLVMGALVLAAVAGCGKGAPSTAPCNCPAPPIQFPSPNPGASSAPLQPGDVATTVAQVQQAFSRLPGFAMNMRWWQKMGSKTASGLYKVEGKAPQAMKVEVLQGKGQGTRLLYVSGNKVKVRAGGLLGAIAIDLDLNDERIRGVRGYTMDQFNVGPILARFASGKNALSLMGEQGGKLFIEAKGPDMLEGCVRMVAGVDAKSLLPRYFEMHDAKEMVVRIDMNDFHQAPAPNLSL